SHGINFNANYTFSHCIGDYAARLSQSASPDMTYQDPNNRRKDRANCEYDQRHAFNMTGVAETPKFANRMLTLVGTGWRLSGIYRASSAGTIVATSQPNGVRSVTLGAAGGALTSTSGLDQCLCDITGQRPNLLLPNAVYLN